MHPAIEAVAHDSKSLSAAKDGDWRCVIGRVAIARGEHKPAPDEPKIWFTSMRSLAEVLSDDNRALLKLIRDENPESLNRLAELSGRAASNLSRTLKTMERHGLVDPRRQARHVRPVAKASEFLIRAA